MAASPTQTKKAFSPPEQKSGRGAADAERHPPPVLVVTRYDRVSSSMIAVVIALVMAVLCLSVVYVTNRRVETHDAVPLEFVELPGGVEDGAIDETLQLNSPEAESSDPSLAEIPAEVSEIQEMLETVVELADEASLQAQQQFELAAQNAGQKGSARGTGRRALGMGPGESGLPREQRWYVHFSDRVELDVYARQLEALGIELAVLRPNGQLIFLSQPSASRPQTRTVTSGRGETRLYMTWRGGNRRHADIQLFRRAGISVGSDLILHFYSPQTEARMARLEREYAGRPVDQIRRTYFLVKGDRGGTEFVVTRQTYFR